MLKNKVLTYLQENVKTIRMNYLCDIDGTRWQGEADDKPFHVAPPCPACGSGETRKTMSEDEAKQQGPT